MCIYVLFVFSLVACYQDYRENKIRNWLICAGLCWGVYQQCSTCGAKGILEFAEGILGIFILMYPLFKLGMIGAGDVKLFAVCAGSMGLKSGFYFLGCTFLAAAVLSLIKMIYHRNFFRRFRYFFNYIKCTANTKQFSLYDKGDGKNSESRVPLAGPVCLSVLLSLGGLY